MYKKTKTAVIAGAIVGLFSAVTQGAVLFDSNGYEAPSGYLLANLHGQVAGTTLTWKQGTAGASSKASPVTVENSVTYQGAQAVVFNRSAGDVDTYLSPVLASPVLTQRYVNVSWEMNVSSGATSDPFFGIYAYNGSDSLGYAGVDATTGKVQYSQGSSGALMTSGVTATLGAWNSFNLQFDYTSKTASIYVNGSFVASAGFIHSTNENSITDADISSFAPNATESGVGTAYFDNYQINTSDTAYVAPANLNWPTLLGSGDGTTWDVDTSQNFSNGVLPATFHNLDNVTFSDAVVSHYAVTINTVVSPGTTTVTNSAGNYTFSGTGGIAGYGSLTKNGSGNLTLSTSNTYSGRTIVNAGTLTIAAAHAFPSGTALTIASGATVVAATHGANAVTVLNVSSLSNAGLLDLTNNAMIVGSSAAFSSVNSQVMAVYNAGHWNGSTGITSSSAAANTRHLTALGVILNDNGSGTPLYGSGGSLGLFDGASPTVDQVLVQYTYYGDTNLNGVVDGSDFSRLDNGALNHLTGWFNGDFNYDGVIDGSDYTLIDNAFNSQSGSPASAVATPTAEVASAIGNASVPEPTVSFLLSMTAVAILTRRRNRKLLS